MTYIYYFITPGKLIISDINQKVMPNGDISDIYVVTVYKLNNNVTYKVGNIN